MNKRILSLLLCLFLMLSLALPVYADEPEERVEENVVRELTISTAEEFLEFAENCRLDTYSQNLEVTLKADIDLAGYTFSGVPIFGGVFDGKDHAITGLEITVDGSMLGLFRYLTETAQVQNLRVSGAVQPGGSKNEIGAIAGRNEGVIRNCTFTGTLSGNDYIGGIAGINTVTGIIENCRTEGEFHGNHFVGGIAGENNGVIRECANSATVNTTPLQNSVEIGDITLDTLTNTEDVNTITDIGGIAGISSGVIRKCDNRGNVGYRHMGYNIGGIAGTQTGYIIECNNHGEVQGRKEVGGIVGQMEPVTLIEFTEDAIQILRGQLDTMSALVNRASGNVQSNASGITNELGVMHDQVDTAKDAVDALLPDEENPELPDSDTVIAALGTVAGTFDDMSGSLRKIASATQSTVYNLNKDLNAISGQIGAMSQTLNNASEHLGGTITDVSDLDTAELFAGKVESSRNYGNVLADLNVGGIAGAMAIENDLDMLEDWLTDGESSLNFQAEVRAVILDCRNDGCITGSKQNVGGITGWQSLGLIKSSANTGTVDAGNANYVGGISGMSTGYLRAVYAKCEILGKTYVGGIAGSGTTVTDSLALVKLVDAKEKQGAILGYAEESRSDDENPIAGNLYLCVGTDYGAIDGISYAGKAEPADADDFMAIENLPDLFKTVILHFVYEDGGEAQVELPLGADLEAEKIPTLPEKAGFVAKWDGLEDAELDGKKLALFAVLFVICLLTVFHVIHYAIMTVIVLAAIAFIDRKLLKKLDVALLATFVCFFIVSGNLGRVDAVRDFLQGLLERSTLLTAVGTSQIISNVPAAVLLSGFTGNWQDLLAGVNIGGLGTPIASLASLITLKLYLRHPGAKAGKFLAVFTVANVIGLVILLAFSFMI